MRPIISRIFDFLITLEQLYEEVYLRLYQISPANI